MHQTAIFPIITTLLKACRAMQMSRLLLFSSLCLSIFTARADDSYQLDIGMGAATGSLPEYLGSPDQYQYLLPIPYLYFKDDSLTLDRNSLTDKLYSHSNFNLSLSASGAIPVKSRNNSLRSGMPDLGWVGELGPSVDYSLSDDLIFAVQLRKAAALNDGSIQGIGWRSSVLMNWHQSIPLKTQWGALDIHTQFSMDFADSTYNNYYYGVEPQYQTAVRPEFAARAGFNAASWSLGMTWQYQQWWLGAYARLYNLSAATNRDSPLLTEHSQLSAGVALSYIFWSK